MFIETLTRLISLFLRQTRLLSEPNISQGMREQTINTVVDLVDEIAQGFLRPNRPFSFEPFNYKEVIYRQVYRSLWDEFGKRRMEYVNYRGEISGFLRSVSSKEFFNAVEYLLNEMSVVVHLQKTIRDDIKLTSSVGIDQWSRKESVRDRHIELFKGAVDRLNHRLSQHKAEYRYKLDGESIQLVLSDTGLDVPKKDNSIREKDDNQPQEHHQNQSHSEMWNRRNYIIAIVLLILTALILFFGDGILIPVWNYLQTIL